MKKLLILFFSIVLFFNGCTKKEDSSKNYFQKINVGMLLPLTGNGALYGKYVREGALLAISELNSSKFTLIIEDTKTTAKDGINSINKLITKNNTPIILGPMSSTVALAVGPIAQKNHRLMITTASSPSISNIGNYSYRIYPSDSYDGKFLAKQTIKQNFKNSLIISLNNDFGIGMVNVFTKEYIKLGGKIVKNISFSPNQKDFTVIISKIKQYSFDNFFIVATQKDYINIINKLENLNILDKPIFAPVNIEDKIVYKNISKEMLNNIQYSKPIFDLNKNLTKLQKKFKNLWFINHKDEPNIFNAYGYDLIHLANKIINDTKYKNYKETLDSYTKLQGVTGNYSFDKNGDVVRKFTLLKLKNLH